MTDKILDEWFPSGRGDGRRFRCVDWDKDRSIAINRHFEPIFKAGFWYGKDSLGGVGAHFSDGKWYEWHAPKKTKKVTLYAPVCETGGNLYSSGGWYSDKSGFEEELFRGWMEMEVEVDDE